MLERLIFDLLKSLVPGLNISIEIVMKIAPTVLEAYHRIADPVQRQAELQALALAALEGEE